MADVFEEEIMRLIALESPAFEPSEPEIVDSLSPGSFVVFNNEIVNGWQDHSWDGQYSYEVQDGSGI